MKQIRICILILIMSILSIGCTSGIKKDKLYVVNDTEKVRQMMEEHTPIRLEVQSVRWGTGIITDQKIIQKVWSQRNQMQKIDKSAYIPQENDLIGTVHFLDGRELPFSIGEKYMQIGYRYYGSNNSNAELKTIYSILKESIYSIQNLQKLVSNATTVLIYSADEEQSDKNYLTEKQVEEMKQNIKHSIMISDVQTLQSMYSERIMPQFFIEVWLDDPILPVDKISGSKDMVLITVYTSEYFTVWDIQQESSRNIIHVQGNMYDFSAAIYHNR